MPVISVILPVYNGERTIQETVESVLNQTFSDLELIVINDGSQDATLEILSRIQDPRLKVFSYSNAGQPASRNRGISCAGGDYISFIDADDLWTPDKLEAQFKALQENLQAAVAYSWTDWIDESGRFIRRGSDRTYNGDVFAHLLLNDFIAGGSNPLIRKQALTEVGGFDESLSNAHDWDMWLRLAAHYHFVSVPSPQILYRQSTGSMSSNVWGMETSSLQIIERAINQSPDSLKLLKRISLGNRYKYLTFKALDGNIERRRGLAAAQFFFQAIRYDLTLLRTRVFWKVWSKIAVISLLPSPLAQKLLNQVKQVSNISALIVQHTRLVPF